MLELLKAIQRIDDDHVKLMVVGSPDFAKSSRTPYLNKVQSLVDELGDRVAFTGYVPNDQVYQYSKSADVQVVPSLWEDAAPTVCMEAMAAGLPLLVTRSGGIQEYTTSECAVIVEKDERIIDSLADALRELNGDSRRLESMSHSRKFTEESFYREFVETIGE